MSGFELTEEAIGQYCTETSFKRGYEYSIGDAVLGVTQRGNQLFSEVQGSEYEPYGVRVTLEGDQPADAICTCPYDWGGYCKHIVATLLCFVHDRDNVAQRPAISEIVAGLGREQFQALIVELSQQVPEIIDLIEELALDPRAPGHSRR
jgi:uncharacterized Zn finger protein